MALTSNKLLYPGKGHFLVVVNPGKVQSAIQFFGLKMTRPSLELFRKFIRFGTVTRPLSIHERNNVIHVNVSDG